MKRFYPSDLDLCHMVPQTAELKSDAGRGAGPVGGLGSVRIRPQWDSVTRARSPALGRPFPQVQREEKNLASCEPVSFAVAESHVMTGADFQISTGKVQGICGSLTADVACRPVT